MTREELIVTFRALADLYEAKPTLPVPYIGELNAFVDTKEEMVKVARALGSCEKGATDSFFYLKKVVGSVTLDFNLERSAACRRVVTGKRTVAEQVIPAHEVEVVEWHCEPVLGPGQTAEIEGVVDGFAVLAAE